MPTLDRFAPPARDLVDAYEVERSAIFAAPGRTILAVGNRLTDPATPQGDLVQRAAALTGSERGILLAAIPFDPGRPASLVQPERVQVTLGTSAAHGIQPSVAGANGPTNGHTNGRARIQANGALLEPAEGRDGPRWRIDPRPSRASYAASVVEALNRIEAGDAGKIVLARSLELTGGGPTDAAAMLRGLAARDPHSYTYAIGLPPVENRRRTLVGASPELLVARSGRRVVARPVAGSAERSTDPAEDRRLGEGLLRSAKDRAEHAFVVEAVREALGPYCRDVTAGTPVLTSTATMWHLQTEVVGELIDPAVSALELALALHPTPAVCGTPTARARAAIGELEGFDRDYYAGGVGWCDESGDGEWVVAIRCAEVREESLRLYAGAGIVAGSEPDAEVRETSAKFRTMLEAMGLHDIA